MNKNYMARALLFVRKHVCNPLNAHDFIVIEMIYFSHVYCRVRSHFRFSGATGVKFVSYSLYFLKLDIGNSRGRETERVRVRWHKVEVP